MFIGDFTLSESQLNRVKVSVAGAVKPKTAKRYDALIEDWIRFLEVEFPDRIIEPTLATMSHHLKCRVLVLYIEWLTSHSMSFSQRLSALRDFFRQNHQLEDPFSDWTVKAARVTATPSGRELSLQRDKKQRLPAPYEFIKYMRSVINETSPATDMMSYLGSALCYNFGFRAGELASGDHTILTDDVSFEIVDFSRVAPWQLRPKLYSTTIHPSVPGVTRKGPRQYFVVHGGGRPGIFTSLTEAQASRVARMDPLYLPPSGGIDGHIQAFPSLSKAVVFMESKREAFGPEIPSQLVISMHAFLRSQKNIKDGTMRMVFVQRGLSLEEDQLLDDLIRFSKAGQAAEGQIFLSRWLDGRHRKLQRCDLCEIIKAAAIHFGLDPTLFSSHCFRIGCATMLAISGLYSEDDIRKYIGWMSKSSFRYQHVAHHAPSALRLGEQGHGLSVREVGALGPRSLITTSTVATAAVSHRIIAPELYWIDDEVFSSMAALPVTNESFHVRLV